MYGDYLEIYHIKYGIIIFYVQRLKFITSLDLVLVECLTEVDELFYEKNNFEFSSIFHVETCLVVNSSRLSTCFMVLPLYPAPFSFR